MATFNLKVSIPQAVSTIAIFEWVTDLKQIK